MTTYRHAPIGDPGFRRVYQRPAGGEGHRLVDPGFVQVSIRETSDDECDHCGARRFASNNSAPGELRVEYRDDGPAGALALTIVAFGLGHEARLDLDPVAVDLLRSALAVADQAPKPATWHQLPVGASLAVARAT